MYIDTYIKANDFIDTINRYLQKDYHLILEEVPDVYTGDKILITLRNKVPMINEVIETVVIGKAIK